MLVVVVEVVVLEQVEVVVLGMDSGNKNGPIA